MEETIVERHAIEVDPRSNGGETVLITTKMIDDGENEPLLIQEISLMLYGNQATITLGGSSVMTPSFLRKMANELDLAIVKATAKLEANK